MNHSTDSLSTCQPPQELPSHGGLGWASVRRVLGWLADASEQVGCWHAYLASEFGDGDAAEAERLWSQRRAILTVELSDRITRLEHVQRVLAGNLDGVGVSPPRRIVPKDVPCYDDQRQSTPWED